MKILMLADVFFPDTIGGAGRVAYHLSYELSKKGHEIYVITRNTNEKSPSHQQLNPNFSIHRFALHKKDFTTLFFSEIKNSYFLAKKLARTISFDLICIHQSMVAIGPLLSGCIRSAPVVFYYHSPWHEEFLIKKGSSKGRAVLRHKIIALLMKAIEKRILRRSKKIIVLSKYMRKKINKIHNYAHEKIRIIPGGVDLDRFKLPDGGKVAAKQSLFLQQDRTIFLTVRNLVPRMGLENLIETFMRSKMLSSKALLLIGGSGFLEDELKSMVDGFNLNGCIKFLGYIPDDDLPTTYQAADFFVLPSTRLEGFGLVILEAMACGTPVLGTPIGAIPEVIGPFDSRLIFDGIRWKDIKRKMEEVVERKDIYNIAPQVCRSFVKKHFSWKKVVDDFENEMERLARG